jgi:hypothetical protein
MTRDSFEEAPVRQLLLEKIFEADLETFAREGRLRVKALKLNDFLVSLEKLMGHWLDDRVRESMHDHKVRLFEQVNDEVFQILERAVRDAASNATKVKEQEAQLNELQHFVHDHIAKLKDEVKHLFEDLKNSPKKLEKEVTRCLDAFDEETDHALDPEEDSSDPAEIDEQFCENARDVIEDLLPE